MNLRPKSSKGKSAKRRTTPNAANGTMPPRKTRIVNLDKLKIMSNQLSDAKHAEEMLFHIFYHTPRRVGELGRGGDTEKSAVEEKEAPRACVAGVAFQYIADHRG
jgi:hypothetical protein